MRFQNTCSLRESLVWNALRLPNCFKQVIQHFANMHWDFFLQNGCSYQQGNFKCYSNSTKQVTVCLECQEYLTTKTTKIVTQHIFESASWHRCKLTALKILQGGSQRTSKQLWSFLLSASSLKYYDFIFRAELIVGLPPRLTSFRIISSESVCSGNKKVSLVQNTIVILFWSILGRFGQFLTLTLALVSENFPPISSLSPLPPILDARIPQLMLTCAF